MVYAPMAALVLPFDLRVVDVVQDWFDTFVRLPTYFRRAGNWAIIRPVTNVDGPEKLRQDAPPSEAWTLDLDDRSE